MNRHFMAGEHRLDAEIARGGFGTVYRATHLPTGAQAAVKILHKELFDDPSQTLRFEREAAVVLKLPHPHIVKVHECGRIADGRPYIVMELLAGESLDKRLAKEGRLSAEEALDILGALASALANAHAHGIVHRDVKPSNVFLAEGRASGRVVLLDFGVAKLLADQGPTLTASRATLGTIPFMAPEQIRGEPIDTRADVYALAALAYAMLTGKPPYGDQATAVLRQLHLHARPKKPSERAPLDPALDEPILRALDPDPSKRPASTTALVASLAEALQHAAPKRPPSASQPDVALRPALVVVAELRADSMDGDEELFDALEASLPIVAAELSRMGLVMLRETSTNLFAVSTEAPNETFWARVLDACLSAHRRFRHGPGRSGRVKLLVVAHEGALHVSQEGTLLASGLVDIASWMPTVSPFGGVVASKAALGTGAEGRAPLSPSSEFFLLER
jgi:serine/threonine-protein kinase